MCWRNPRTKGDMGNMIPNMNDIYWNAARIMAISPKDWHCQCLPDIISAAVLSQTYFAQVGLGGWEGERRQGGESSAVFLIVILILLFFLLLFRHRHSQTHVTESVCCCPKRHSVNYNALKLEPAKESTPSSFVSSLTYYSYQSIQMIEKSRLR